MPAEEAEGFFLIRKRTIPTILFRNQIAQVLAFGLRFHFWNAGLWHGLFGL
jgi:hypothetical protein